MATAKNKPARKNKPYLTGAPTDEYTVRQALKFFGILFICMFMLFIVCSMTGFQSAILRITVNLAIEILILYVFFSKGAELGTDAVARGEILYQHIEKGTEASASERKVPFHKLKGFIIGACGTVLFLIMALILSFTAKRQMTGAGALPSWLEGYLRRPDISGALAGYSQAASLTVTDIVRIAVRMLIMPFIQMADTENREALLLIERLSPVLVLLPAAAYGIGYLQGPSRRTAVHTEIANNRRKRTARENRERKARIRQAAKREPEQLN